ncbi:HalOD1 output domain-containing protein [Halosolutus gelatinilyticus]|uniref:HalOD1 output domain-containing protein n=1 Tax=Halosolutus gelatinilyticus TaxID=2931975 RepID=UPI001FF50FCC|nr:HalOD1 output domain-containing protein [Halosolutus gelatinilyticus]
MGLISESEDGADNTIESATGLIYCVAEEKDKNPAEMENPLHDAIDADVIDRFLQSADHQAYIKFEYEGLRIKLTGGGDLMITRLADED